MHTNLTDMRSFPGAGSCPLASTDATAHPAAAAPYPVAGTTMKRFWTKHIVDYHHSQRAHPI